MNHKKIQTFIKKINTEYNVNEIIGSFVYCFKTINKINQLGIESEKFFAHKKEELIETICKQFDSFSVKDLEVVFENIIDNERKKKEGVVYTPDYIIDYIINHSIKVFKSSSNDIPIICDPACGSGGFLIQALEILTKEYDLSYADSLKYIRGTDINSQSIQCAKILIEAFFGSKKLKAPVIDNLFSLDTLLTDPEDYLTTINAKKGVDILATNPPYVKLQHLDFEYREKLLSKFSEYANGSFSTAILFLLVGHKLLSNSGVLGYITQNNFFTSLAAKNIRQYIQEEKALNTIIDFVHTKVFENASAYTCLIFLTKQKNDSFFFQWSLNPKKELPSLQLKNDLKLDIENLNSKKWRLAPKKHLENLHKIENAGKKLKEVADIRVGYATLKDAIFTFKDNLDLEEELIRPAIKIAEWNNEENMKGNKLKIIFPYKKINERYIAIDEKTMEKQYPKTYKYLLQFKNELSARDKGKLNLKYFYEWGRTQAMEAPGPKLLTKTFSKGPNFMLDPTDSLFCNGYSVKPKNEQEMPILVLQKILNSIVMDYYTKVTSFQIEGNYQCFQKNFIEIFGIPELSEADKEKILQLENTDSFLCNLYHLDINELKEVIER